MTPPLSCDWKFRMLAAIALLAAFGAHAAPSYVNTSAGGALKPGVYGRIEIRNGPPPPLIYDQPVTVTQSSQPRASPPVYLYVPPGQVRKWPRHCAKYHACDVPVLFVRMDNSPSKLGKWKSRTEFARRDAEMALRTMGGPPARRD